MTDRRDFEGKMQHYLNEVQRKIEQMESLALDEARTAYREDLNELESRRQHFAKKLADLQAASQDAWLDLRQGVESAWLDLQQSLEKASTQLEQA